MIVFEIVFVQEQVCDVFVVQFDFGCLVQCIVVILFNVFGIDICYIVIEELLLDVELIEFVFYDWVFGCLFLFGMKVCNDFYMWEVFQLFVEVVCCVFDVDLDLILVDVMYVIMVLCIGFYVFGLEYEIVWVFGLLDVVQCYYLGFMGCYVFMFVLCVVGQFCMVDEDVVVLVVSVELCMLYLCFSEDLDMIVVFLFFVDGVVVGIVIVRDLLMFVFVFWFDGFYMVIVLEGVDDMVWMIGDFGFEMIFLIVVLQIIGELIIGVFVLFYGCEDGFVEVFVVGCVGDWVCYWVIYFGGCSIFDCVQEWMVLSDVQLCFVWEMFWEYGNMFSVIVLFVLKCIFEQEGVEVGDCVVVMVFGLGFIVESVLLIVVVFVL